MPSHPITKCHNLTFKRRTAPCCLITCMSFSSEGKTLKQNVQEATYLPYLAQRKRYIEYYTARVFLIYKTVLTYKQTNFTCSGAITPGQLGPTRRDFDCFSRSCFTFTISCCGTPSVIHTISGTSASIASIIAFAAPGGGT